jgi:bisanhydrobacterioruberin hydratase
MSDEKLTLKSARLFLLVFYAVGIAGFSWSVTHDLFQRLVSFNLLVSFALLFSFHQTWSRNHIVLFSAIAISGFLIEMAGIQTGLVFGDYSYGKALGVKVLSTPLLIGVNWLVLVYCVYVLFNELNRQWYYPLLGAGLLVLFDVVMEPVAIATDMWSWQGGAVPLKNYVTWYIVSAIMLYALRYFRISYKNKIASWLLVIQFLFFLILGFIL